MLNSHFSVNREELCKDLNSAARMLFDTLLNESCHYIIEISSTLPGFELKATQELLKRESTLLEKLQLILDSLPSHAVGENQAENIFETNYHRRIARILDILQIFGLSSDPIYTRYKLSIAYISLSVSQEYGDGYLEDGVNYSGGPAEEVISSKKRVLIRGEAGSGKTTLLQWIAVNAARNLFESNLLEWGNKTPFILQLRNYSSRALPTPDEFLIDIAKPLMSEMPTGWVQKKLRYGSSIVLIDGVDEVHNEKRKEVLEWLSDLVNEFHRSVFIVTSRPSAIPACWLDDLGFESFILEPMGRTDITAFISHWHNALRESDNSADFQKRIEECRSNLVNLFKESTPIRGLATNPLMCAMICAINMDRNSLLPSERSELYRIAFESLVHRRDPERFKSSIVNLNLPFLIKEIFLRNFAFWMMINGKSKATTRELRSRVNNLLQLMPNVNNTDSEISQFLLERTGVLREPTTGSVDFIHKTFQEYLTAKHIAAEDLTKVLSEKALDDYWIEVIVLFSSLSNNHQTDLLISEILRMSEINTDDRHKLLILAASCAAEASFISPEILKKVKDGIDSILPPNNFEESRKIASSGDLAIPLLTKYYSHNNGKVVAYCVRALSNIASDGCIAALEKFGYSKDKRVLTEIIKAWQNFDQKDYGDRVVAKTNFRGPLKWQSYPTTEGLSGLTNLREILFCGNEGLKNIDELRFCTSLTSIDFTGCESLENLDSLSKLINLKELDLSDCFGIKNIKNLCNLKSLEILSLKNCSITSLEGLADLVNMRTLDLTGCIELSHIKEVKGLTNLESLYLGGCYGIHDLSPIESLPFLNKLIIPDQFALDTLSKETQDRINVDFE
ncbi:NACHT domain-containing protein [Nitrosomonas sp.]|uniref:NACHT domain-containing protein n=1 Tax=Nitrosomonas sp. TaxID=42353 RepID=UPI0025D49AFF|nr:NACHT domain-containing protein [Nitrosomonas sp.]